MADVLLILHFTGLMLAAAGVVGGLFALGGGVQAPRGRSKGKGGNRHGRVHSAIASLGLVLILPSGVVLLTAQKVLPPLGAMFWMKLVFTALLTFAVVAIELVHNGGLKRSGNVLASLGPLAGLSLIAGVIFSVLAFH